MRRLKPVNEYPTTPGKWRKRYKCHKNKGDHTFVVEHASRIEGYKYLWGVKDLIVFLKCSACGKQDVELEKW